MGQSVSQLFFDYSCICITPNVFYLVRPWNTFSNSLYSQEFCMKGRNCDIGYHFNANISFFPVCSFISKEA